MREYSGELPTPKGCGLPASQTTCWRLNRLEIGLPHPYYSPFRTECFDDYSPCWREKKNCKARHAWNWLSLFQIWHNIAHVGFNEPIKAELLSIEALG
ncbi:MAG: hypothetical protein QW265_00510, partial [Candidatus Bathyarchaeia archaeon]